ncbi:MAG: tetratricopeptide repeat protein, partial [bacterium]
MASLRTALRHDPTYAEARVYLANILYDAEDLEGALREFERTEPQDHWDELGIFRVIELKKARTKDADMDGAIAAWEARLVELAGVPDPI